MVYDAILDYKTDNPEAIAEGVKLRSGVILESKAIADLFSYGVAADLSTVYEQLFNMRNIRRQVELYQQAIIDLETGKVKPEEGPDRVYQNALKFRRVNKDGILDSENWAAAIDEYAEHQKKLIANNKQPTLPPEMGQMREDIPYLEECTMILIVGKTASGKSIDAQQISDHLARTHGRHVLNINTELNRRQVLWRRIVRLSAKRCVANKDYQFKEAISYDWLKAGNTSALVKELTATRTGKIRDWDAGNMTIADIIAMARSMGYTEDGVKKYPDLIVDYWDMIDFRSSIKLAGSNDASSIGAALTTLKAYAQDTGSIIVIVQQTDKAAHLAPTVSAFNAKDSINFPQRANLAWSLNYPNDKGRVIEHPFSKKLTVYNPGVADPIGYRKVDKDTFAGNAGKKYDCYLDRFFWAFGAKNVITKPLSDIGDDQPPPPDFR